MMELAKGRAVKEMGMVTSSAKVVKSWHNERTGEFCVEYDDPNLDNPAIQLPQEIKIEVA
jgi:hypothetical protein